MARNPDATSRIEILVLSTLARLPMHGYEIAAELRYRHVHWWAKCQHGHLYAAIARLERSGLIRRTGAGAARGRRVYELTAGGRKRLVAKLHELGAAADATYFDVDLFLSGAFTLTQAEAVAVLEARTAALRQQHAEARALRRSVGRLIPTAGRLIVEHRIEHLARELRFARRAAALLRAERAWGPFLGRERIADFVARTGVALEAARQTSA